MEREEGTTIRILVRLLSNEIHCFNLVHLKKNVKYNITYKIYTIFVPPLVEISNKILPSSSESDIRVACNELCLDNVLP